MLAAPEGLDSWEWEEEEATPPAHPARDHRADPSSRMPPDPTTITGQVSVRNDRGVRLRGEDGWRNWSRWADNPDTPDVGRDVVLKLDRDGFVRDWRYAEDDSR